MAQTRTKIVVGLGNYGDKYAYSYHNMGFMVVDCLADRYDAELRLKDKLKARMAEFWVGDNKVILAQPWTYMNLSGLCVQQLLAYYKVGLQDLIVVFDDIDIDMGKIRVRQNGSGGTHNGMRNIISLVDSKEFVRVRVGIGKPPQHFALVDWVTSTVPKDLRPIVAQGIEQAADEVARWIISQD